MTRMSAGTPLSWLIMTKSAGSIASNGSMSPCPAARNAVRVAVTCGCSVTVLVTGLVMGSPWSRCGAPDARDARGGERLPSGRPLEVPAHRKARPPVEAAGDLGVADRAQAGTELVVREGPEAQTGVVRRVPGDVAE